MKTILTEPHAVIGHTMSVAMPSLSHAVMYALRQSDPREGELIMVDNGEVSVINPQQGFDLDRDFQRIIQDQDERRLAKMEQDKKSLSEIIERERGVKFVNHDMRTIYEDPHPSSKSHGKIHKPNTGIHIGSYKKHPKRSKPKY